MENKNISKIKDCYGCGVCSIVCGKKIIQIRLNENGFYEPYIEDLNKCSNCGLCINVCSYSHENLSLKTSSVHSYAAWSKDKTIRRKCSSGGVGFELGRMLIKKEYKVCGVRYNAEKNQAEHYIATTVEELIQSIGSKYIQSYTLDGFKAINRKEKYLVTGTPCQIDSFRRYIQRFNVEDNFVLMDFFCHGVPSKLMWDRYIQEVEKITGKITYVSWRNKFTGWHDSWVMSIDGENTGKAVNWNAPYNSLIKEKKGFYNSKLSQGDIFFRLFLSNACLGKACYEKCKFKNDQSSADIRIGDLWGKTYQHNEDGVSAAIAFTNKGNVLLKESNCILIKHSFKEVSEGQMKTSPKMNKLYFNTAKLLKEEGSIEEICQQLKKHEKIETWKKRIYNPLRSIKNLLKRL